MKKQNGYRVAQCDAGVTGRRARPGLLGLALAATVGCSASATPPATGARSAALTAASRPASVPAEFALTPYGYMHPSCVIEVGRGERLRADATIARADGSTRTLAPCGHQRFDRDGRALVDGAATQGISPHGSQKTPPPPDVNGWVSDANDNAAHGPYQGVSAIWNVPAAPSIPNGQTVYIFPGLQNSTILQPVLGWNHFGDGARWSIASWNCCKDGNALHSGLVPVSVGDEIVGSVEGSNCDGNNVCADWTITTTDNNIDSSTGLTTTSYGDVESWLFGGALEVYGIKHCAQYPSDGQIFFHHITATQVGGNVVTFPWTTHVDYSASPYCANDVSAPDATALTISFAQVLRPTPERPGCGNIYAGQGIIPGQSVLSCNAQFILQMQLDGNLVLYPLGADGSLGAPIWATNTNGDALAFDAVMQSDGNFVLYDMQGHPLWAAGTYGHPGSRFAVQDDGNLVVYGPSNEVLWVR